MNLLIFCCFKLLAYYLNINSNIVLLTFLFTNYIEKKNFTMQKIVQIFINILVLNKFYSQL